jgi:hypothetical protein
MRKESADSSRNRISRTEETIGVRFQTPALLFTIYAGVEPIGIRKLP